MTALDWVLVVVWVGVALCGFWKGAVRLVLGIGGGVAGIGLAVVAGFEIADRIEPAIGVHWLAVAVGWLAPILICVGVCLAAGWGLEKTFKALHLSWLNRLLGAVFAATAAAILLAVLMVTAAGLSPTWADLCARSRLMPYLMTLLGFVAEQAEEIG